MSDLLLGSVPGNLTVRLIEGDGAELVATLVDDTGAAIDWPDTPSLSFAHGVSKAVIDTFDAVIDGETATWTLTREHVEAVATGSLPRRSGVLYTRARITMPATDDADGRVGYAGKVVWADGWASGDRTQLVTFTLPGGPPGAAGRGIVSITDVDGDGVATITYTDGTTASLPLPEGPPGSGGGGGSDALIIVGGGTVELNDDLEPGATLGYLVEADTDFTDGALTSTLVPGAYTFVRTSSGWDFYPATGGVALGAVPDTTAPTAGTLTATGGVEEVALSVTGALDETALHAAPYSFSVDGGSTWGAWQAGSTAVITELAAGAIVCRHRVRDAAGNISLGATKNATVAGPELPLVDAMLALDPAWLWMLDDEPDTTVPEQLGSQSPDGNTLAVGVEFGSEGIGNASSSALFDGLAYIRSGIPNGDARLKTGYTITALIHATANNKLIMQGGGGYAGFQVSNTSVTAFATNVPITGTSPIGAPCRMTVVYDSGTLRVYRNATLIGTNTGADTANGLKYMNIGAWEGGSATGGPEWHENWFVGRIAAFGIYHTALTMEQIASIAASDGLA